MYSPTILASPALTSILAYGQIIIAERGVDNDQKLIPPTDLGGSGICSLSS